MNLRLAIIELAARHHLSAKDVSRLRELAGFHQQPPKLGQYGPAGLALIAAVLGGLGVVFWIAANWETVTRATRFGILQGFFAVMCLGAMMRPAARAPLGLVAFLGTGGLLALFGQTYQTGADPWQLFAWWASLTLPLCFGVKHDAMWGAWSIVAMTALRLWSRAEDGYAWTSDVPFSIIQLLHWFGAILPAIALSPMFKKFTGAGVWSFRLCVLLAVSAITFDSLTSVFNWYSPGQYFVGLALLSVLLVAFCRPLLFDMFALCALALALNVLIDAGIGRALEKGHTDFTSALLVFGLSAAGLLGATVKAIRVVSQTGGVNWSFQ